MKHDTQRVEELAVEELEAQQAVELPDRELMSLINLNGIKVKVKVKA